MKNIYADVYKRQVPYFHYLRHQYGSYEKQIMSSYLIFIIRKFSNKFLRYLLLCKWTSQNYYGVVFNNENSTAVQITKRNAY